MGGATNSVDLGGRRIIKKKNIHYINQLGTTHHYSNQHFTTQTPSLYDSALEGKGKEEDVKLDLQNQKV